MSSFLFNDLTENISYSPEENLTTSLNVDRSGFRMIRTFRGDLHPDSLREIFHLRYQVYCLECAFLPKSDFCDEMEYDKYEACSTHFGAYTRKEEIVGTIRLVQPWIHMDYPFEEHCRIFDGLQLPPRELSGEVSRLVVRKDFRRRKGDSWNGVPQTSLHGSKLVLPDWHDTDESSDRESPTLLLAMYREMYRHSLKIGVRYWFAAMERSLARSLKKLGFGFLPIGPQTNYYGTVTPFMIDLHELERTLRYRNYALAEWFHRDTGF
jgi:N-acyl amino acid synthase of PEP-CTERM/exosortase system